MYRADCPHLPLALRTCPAGDTFSGLTPHGAYHVNALPSKAVRVSYGNRLERKRLRRKVWSGVSSDNYLCPASTSEKVF